MTRRWMYLALTSTDPRFRSQTIDLISRQGNRFFKLLDTFEQNSASAAEQMQIMRARRNLPSVPIDAAEFQAFDYFTQRHVEMRTQFGHVTSLNAKMAFDEEACVRLSELQHLQDLTLQDSTTSLKALSAVNGMPDLKLVTVPFDTSRRADASLEMMATLPSLSVLYLNQWVTDRGMKALHGMTSLRKLDLLSRKLTDEGVMELMGCTGLEEVRIKWVINDATVDALLGLTNLRTLQLSSCPITDEGVAKLASLPNLDKLSLGYCLWVEGDCMTALSAAPKLKNLEISVADCEHVVSYLQKFRSLERATIQVPSWDARIVDVLIGCPKLKYASISRGGLSDENIERLYQHFGRGEVSGVSGIHISPERKPVTYQK